MGWQHVLTIWQTLAGIVGLWSLAIVIIGFCQWIGDEVIYPLRRRLRNRGK